MLRAAPGKSSHREQQQGQAAWMICISCIRLSTSSSNAHPWSEGTLFLPLQLVPRQNSGEALPKACLLRLCFFCWFCFPAACPSLRMGFLVRTADYLGQGLICLGKACHSGARPDISVQGLTCLSLFGIFRPWYFFLVLPVF